MSGHSKWSKIKRAKESTDAAKGKVFTKLGREIAVAVKEGGSDPNTNNRLKLAIQKAKQANMPSDKIKNMLNKSNTDIDYISQLYEGYGIGGVAVMVECLTDNKNRTAGDVRFLFSKYGGSLGSSGCVGYMFENRGVVSIEKGGAFDEDAIMEIALEYDAEDYENDEDIFIIYTAVGAHMELAQALSTRGYIVIANEDEKIPSNYIQLDENQRNSFEKMIDLFEEHDDVQNVYHNLED